MRCAESLNSRTNQKEETEVPNAEETCVPARSYTPSENRNWHVEQINRFVSINILEQHMDWWTAWVTC